MTYRYYSSTAVATYLTAPMTPASLVAQVQSAAGFPTSFPYTLILELGTSNEEVIEVGSGSGLSLNVTRGIDGSTALTHSVGAAVIHGVSARDFKEWQDHVAASQAVHGLAAGSAVVGTNDTQTLSGKTFTSPTINTPTVTGGTYASPTLNTPTINTPAITGGTASGVTSTGATITAPAISNPTVTGGGSWAGSPSIAAPTLTGQPTVTDLTHMTHTHANAANGGSTLTGPSISAPAITGGGSWAGSPALTSPAITGGGSWAGSPALTSPSITTPTVTTPAITGGGSWAGGPALSAPVLTGGLVADYLIKQSQTWQTPSLGSGWAQSNTGGTFANLQFRIDAEDNLVIMGAVHTTTTSAATTIFTLPSGYIPKGTYRFITAGQSPGPTFTINSIAVNGQSVATNGAVVLTNAVTVTSADFYFDFRIPMGNIT